MERGDANHPDYSTLEVDNSVQLPEVRPNHDLPQVKADGHMPEALPGYVDPRQATILGLRRRNLWIALIAVVTLVVIAVGVGVGVGVGGRSGSSDGSGVAHTPGRIASFSSLAAVNYTDRQLVEHNVLYYQDNNLDIWMADLDSSTKQWSLKLINITDMDPKNGTPLAASVWAGVSQLDFHIRFVSATSHKIRALYAPNRGFDIWQSAGPPDKAYRVTNDSRLAQYDQACTYCDKSDMTVFRSENTKGTASGSPYNDPTFIPPDEMTPGSTLDEDTAYAIIPVWGSVQGGEKSPYVGLYLSAQRRLKQFYFRSGDRWHNTSMSLDLPINPGAHIAAFSCYEYYNDTRYVLITRKDGGVAMAYPDGAPEGDWACMASVSGMESVRPLSPIAATQSGRVFTLREGRNGTEVVHFRCNGIDGTPTFEFVEVVNPTMAA